MELSYVQQGEYFFPKLCFEAENPPIGKYGLLRKSYLKEHKRGWYSSLLLTGKLDEHPLKAADQMEWVRRMNNIRASAEEIVLSELVYC